MQACAYAKLDVALTIRLLGFPTSEYEELTVAG